MTTPPKPARVPELLVEKLRLGELSPEDAASVRARLEAEPPELGGLSRLAELDADDRATLGAHPRLAVRRAPAARPWLRVAIPGVFAAVAAALIVARLPSGPGPDGLGRSAGDTAGLRDKGGALSPQLIVYRQTATGAEPLADGARAAAGDVLQLAYVAAGRTYGAIASVDGRGQTTVHLPSGPLAKSGGEVLLPAAYRLDDAPDFERFVLMTLEPKTGALEVTTVTLTKPAAPRPAP